MLNSVLYFFLYLSFAASLLPLIIGIVYYKQLPKKALIFFFYIVFMILLQIFIIFTADRQAPNHTIITLSHVVRFLFLGAIFLYWSPKSLKIQLSLIYASGIFLNVLFLFLNASIMRSISSGTMILMSIIFLIYLAFTKIQFISSDGRFWIMIGTFLYFIITFTLFLLSKQILDNFDIMTARAIFTLNPIMVTTHYIFYAKGLLCLRNS